MTPTKKILLALVALLLLFVLGAAGWAWYKISSIEAKLPSVQSLREPNLGAPLRIYSADGKLIGEFGAERRSPLSYEQFPEQVIRAFLAAEDDQFFEHGGVDYMGLVRAAFKLAATGEKRQGGSTITMQLARNVFLTPERSYERKIREILLAQKIERELDKKRILEIYLNRIFLGTRAYGVAAAAYVYFGKSLNDLTLAETAVLAALPKAPSALNPLTNPKRALERRDYVLRRMHELNYIDDATYAAAKAEPILAQEHAPPVDLDAAYVAEMVRADLFAKHGEAAYTAGFKVVTTIDSARQKLANNALRDKLLDYEERHGYPGAEAKLESDAVRTLERSEPLQNEAVIAALRARPIYAGLPAALVLDVSPERIKVVCHEWGNGVIEAKGFAWAGKQMKLVPGDIVRIRKSTTKDGDVLRLAQVPGVQGAFVALDPRDGAIEALVGGYDFAAGKFNRVTQAKRQPGSGFKPFLYAAALAKGYTPASIFIDAPIVLDETQNQNEWRPSNYDNDFKGPMRLREALVQSRNLVSIRVLQAVGMSYALNYAQNFGLDKKTLPRDLTLSLGTASLSPLEVARGYAVIANGGFLIEPYIIKQISDARGQIIYEARPVKACPECPPEIEAGDPTAQLARRTMDPKTVYMITSMLHDVVVRGTGAAVNQLGRRDLAGKTGTSNDETDAWFNGFHPTLAATVWVGYDQPKPMGKGEVGGRAALPMWMDFMRGALKGVVDMTPIPPPGMTTVRINAVNGKLAYEGTERVVYETLPLDRLPEEDDGLIPGQESEAGAAAQDLF
ncbi:MAG: PBP1A family penicillin-binding protein [Stagnimonas sp.]|nr:PBP1A family penicillin-binding protein [Stagnimonas sp.]